MIDTIRFFLFPVCWYYMWKRSFEEGDFVHGHEWHAYHDDGQITYVKCARCRQVELRPHEDVV